METTLADACTRFFSPVGELGLRAGPRGLREVRWLREDDARDWSGPLAPADLPSADTAPAACADPACAVLAQAVEALERYFGGEPLSSTVPLDLSGLSRFRQRVMRTLGARIPAGEVVTYGELACLAGCPGAARAVGRVMAQNTLPLFVPCHRVVGVTGPGGFGPGLLLKQQLLRLEGVELAI